MKAHSKVTAKILLLQISVLINEKESDRARVSWELHIKT